MNQVTNLIQWKNLTDEQREKFDFKRIELYENDKGLSETICLAVLTASK